MKIKGVVIRKAFELKGIPGIGIFLETITGTDLELSEDFSSYVGKKMIIKIK